MRLSYSALSTYQSCPLKYKFQQIDRIKTPKSKEAVFGTIMHGTLKFIHTPGIVSPTLEQSLDYFSRNWNSDVFEEEIEERSAFSQGIEMIRKYYQNNEIHRANIVDLESRFQFEISSGADKHIVSGIVDRIDKIDDGYEIIDYKTTKKMPSQETVDKDLQLSVYLKAFLSRYPKEIVNVNKIKVSLYFLKHGVKLSSERTIEQLKESEKTFLDVISDIENTKFEPQVSPLCDWCGYQKMCPMWRHKFKDERKIDSKEVEVAISKYIQLKNDQTSAKSQMAGLQEQIAKYMDQEGVERVFSDEGTIARCIRRTYKYDKEKLKEILEPIGKWDEILKIDGILLNKLIKSVPNEQREKIESGKILNKETKSFSVKKN